MPQIVFVSLFLGLVAGVQPIDLRVDPSIKSVKILLGTRELATLRGAPWHADVDLGPELVPQELSALGFDERGDEIARTSQILNLPRPIAEVEIAVKQENGAPAAVELIGRHLQFAQPKKATITLDGKPLRMQKFTAPIPKLDPTHTHVLTAEMTFVDNRSARRELVLSGGFSYSSGSELTPILITGKKGGSLDGCFSVDGQALRTAAVERATALVVVVKDPDPREVQTALDLMRVVLTPGDFQGLRIQLDPDSKFRIVWPLWQSFTEGAAESALFENSNDFDATRFSVVRLLAIPFPATDYLDKPRRFADAIAVAAVRTLMPAQRRAVVLLLSRNEDHSAYAPAIVRRYLQAIGVPLFVWSLKGPRPDLAETWGEVEDISRPPGIRAAVNKLREVLDQQRIVWVPADALSALRVQAKESCGVSVVARR
jgi:hypothetical protein